MKRLFLLGLVLLGGCVVQSFQPFYGDAYKADAPEVFGQWKVASIGADSNVAYKAWVFTEDYKLLTHDDKGPSGHLQTTFFKIGTQLFCDAEIVDIPEGKFNAFWMLHIRGTHTLCKADVAKDKLTFTPLSFDWFKKALAAKEVDLPHVRTNKEDDFLMTATGDQWAKFLRKYAADTNAFPEANAFVLRKPQS